MLLGNLTGRDGIGGVSVLASAGFSDDTDAEDAKRPNVQVGDPFEEKRLIEACLQLLDEGLVVGIQDLGGAGLACATSETASRGGVGMDVDVSAVPRREPGMEPWEVMTSESQERMLAIVGPEAADRVLAVCGRWEVRATVVGKVTGTGQLRILDGWDGEVLADVPAVDPSRRRPHVRPADGAAGRSPGPPGGRPGVACRAPADCGAELLALLMDPSWVYRQYDHQLFLNTVVAPGGDAALLRLAAPGVPAPGDGVRGSGPVDRRQRPLVLRSTRGPGPPSSWPNRPSTWPAWAAARWPWSTAATSATRSTPKSCGSSRRPSTGWPRPAGPCRCPSSVATSASTTRAGAATSTPRPSSATLGLVDDLRRPTPRHRPGRGSQLLLVGAVGPGATSLAGSRWAVDRRGHRGGRLPAAGPASCTAGCWLSSPACVRWRPVDSDRRRP